MKRLLMVLVCAAPVMFGAEPGRGLTEQQIQAAIDRGSSCENADKFEKELHHEGIVKNKSMWQSKAGGQQIVVWPGRLRIAMAACRAKIMMKPFDMDTAKSLDAGGTVTVYVYISSIGGNGQVLMDELYGRSILEISSGGHILEPIQVDDARYQLAGGLETADRQRIGDSNTGTASPVIDLRAAHVQKVFAFDTSGLTGDEVELILVDTKGHKTSTKVALDKFR